MPPLRVLQVSDLHAGTREEPEVEGDLRTLVAQTEPELVVPGNHDIPRWPPWRFTSTFDEFLRFWPELEPVYRSERLVVVGLNSVRPWKQQGGALRDEQLQRVSRVFADTPDGALRMVAVHHHLLGAPWRSHKRTIANRSTVLGALVDAGAELIVSGHVHQSVIGERREFEVVAGDVHGTAVVTAPGLGQPRPKRRGEARGLHLFEADERSIPVLTYAWAETSWAQIADRRFPRGLEPLSTIGWAARVRGSSSACSPFPAPTRPPR